LDATNPVYKIYDLGTLETDESHALAINDKGLVLGKYYDHGKWHLFLWDPVEGLKTIKSQFANNSYHSKLNNHGHFVMSYSHENKRKAYYWDEEWGFIQIFPNNAVDIIDFNDNDQVVIGVTTEYSEPPSRYWSQINYYIWNKGEITDIKAIFSQEVKGEWQYDSLTAINNLGEIVVKAQKEINISTGKKTVYKSFLYTNGKFKRLLPEADEEQSIEVIDVDDEKNLIVKINNKKYYYNPHKRLLAYFFERFFGISDPYKLYNGIPIRIGSLPGKLKTDEKGEYYFGPGVQITKLIETNGTPFLKFHSDVDNPTLNMWIIDQNSKGYVVGYSEALYPGSHAFIAIPEEQTGS
jgi:hypothetical protein